MESCCDTPICDALAKLAGRNIATFHTSTLATMNTLKSSKLFPKFNALFGGGVPRHDLTVVTDDFDNPVFPKTCIKASCRGTAEAFGAMHSEYVTGGTTSANHVVVHALATDGTRVLAGTDLHISLEAALRECRARVDFGPRARCDTDSGRAALDVERFTELYQTAFEAGDPYKLVIVNGLSYEGLGYRLDRVIEKLVQISDDVVFVIDEAWFAFGAFHPKYRSLTAMSTAEAVASANPDKHFSVVSTQSAHKTLNALRQGSFIHAFGEADVVERIRLTKPGLHTTSPSYPILASLELARAQAVLEGEQRIETALALAHSIRTAIREETALQGYTLNESKELENDDTWLDPLRISINASNISNDLQALKRFLLADHAVYVNHVTPTSVLAHVHLGVDRPAVDQLLEGLRAFARRRAFDSTSVVTTGHVCAYPPGVVIRRPGDLITAEIRARETALRRNGVEIFELA